MASRESMDERKMRILEAVTDDYISTAEPVGSRAIARRYNLGISPATIRNEMADLEESGYLEQPHTSAGRIPSQKGYRFYVDFIMKAKGISSEERQRIQHELEKKRREVDLLIEETAHILAQLSRYAAFVLSPMCKAGAFKRLELIPVDDRAVLVVLIVDPGLVKTHLVATARQLARSHLDSIASFLNSRLRNVPLSKMGSSLLRDVKAELDEYGTFLDAALDAVARSLEPSREEQVYTDGQMYILEQPEFRDVAKARAVLELLGEEDAVYELLASTVDARDLRVVIGRESAIPGMSDCSMVSAPYEVCGVPMGALGVLGPTRMHYSRVVALVEIVAESLGDVLTRMLAL